MVHEMKHPANGGTTARLLASPIRMSETPVTYRHAPPLLGEHTAEVMSGLLGLEGSELEELSGLGVIG
jgi:crotonobetainyl-CoA:carnitine CoA-transferase CaiB-like acyl-CoA transferase